MTAPGEPEPVLSVSDVTVRYPGQARDALAGVSFDLWAGEIVGILGRNGAGKSTLCRCLNGIVPQLVDATMAGSVRVSGTDVATTPVRRLARLVGVALDEPAAQLSQPTVADEVALGLESLAMPRAEMEVRVSEVLERMGLDGLEARPPASLSGGQQQRLLLASMLAMRPRVLVLDEAAAGLDPLGRAAVYDALRDLATGDGMAVLVVDHDVEMLAERADRVLVLDGGRLVGDGSPASILGNPAAIASASIRVPDVTAVALGVEGFGRDRLPVTFTDGVAWLSGRP